MSKLPLPEADVEALASLVDRYICPIQYIPSGDTRVPPGRHKGTGWLFERDGLPNIVTCEHIAVLQKHGHLGYSCFACDSGISIEGGFYTFSHPVDAAVASIRRSFGQLQHEGQCVTESLLATRHEPVPGELFYACGFPGADSRQFFDTQAVVATAVFLRQVKLNPEVFKEELPHPDPAFHISLAWSPEDAIPMLGTRGSLSLPDGMSGSPLWNTRYEEITGRGDKWNPSDARITGMIWGHSSKACQLYATPIEAFAEILLG